MTVKVSLTHNYKARDAIESVPRHAESSVRGVADQRMQRTDLQ